MSFVIYRQGMIGYPKKYSSADGVDITVIELDDDEYFTEAGFLFPISRTGVAVEDLIMGNLPGPATRRTSTNSSAFMITHKGAISRIDVYCSGDKYKGWTTDFHRLPSGKKSSYVLCQNDLNRHMLTAALLTWENEEKFQRDTDTMFVDDNSTIVWISVEDIVKRLNELYPNAKEEFYFTANPPPRKPRDLP